MKQPKSILSGGEAQPSSSDRYFDANRGGINLLFARISDAANRS